MKPDICKIPVRCTLPSFIVFFSTNILRLCRFLIAEILAVEEFKLNKLLSISPNKTAK